MDTRHKITSLGQLPELLANGKWTIAVGSFDPLTADQASRLHALVKPDASLLVVIEPGFDPLLSAEARAALMAALRHTARVVIADRSDWKTLIPAGAQVTIDEDSAAEIERSAAFIEFVLRRQQTGQ